MSGFISYCQLICAISSPKLKQKLKKISFQVPPWLLEQIFIWLVNGCKAIILLNYAFTTQHQKIQFIHIDYQYLYREYFLCLCIYPETISFLLERFILFYSSLESNWPQTELEQKQQIILSMDNCGSSAMNDLLTNKYSSVV